MLGQRIGYIRVSTFDQHTERQLDGIEVDKAFTNKASGKDTKRPQLELLMSFVRSGDTVIVHSTDRLARQGDRILNSSNNNEILHWSTTPKLVGSLPSSHRST
jgi:DNA invertase Pin-like site-specific DNA recombinase